VDHGGGNDWCGQLSVLVISPPLVPSPRRFVGYWTSSLENYRKKSERTPPLLAASRLLAVGETFSFS